MEWEQENFVFLRWQIVTDMDDQSLTVGGHLKVFDVMATPIE